MDDDYDEYRRWDGDVDVEVCFSVMLFFNFVTYLIIKI